MGRSDGRTREQEVTRANISAIQRDIADGNRRRQRRSGSQGGLEWRGGRDGGVGVQSEREEMSASDKQVEREEGNS